MDFIKQTKNDELKANEDIKVSSWELSQLLPIIPKIYHKKKFSDFKINYYSQKRVKEIAILYVDTFKKYKKRGANLIFIGSACTGKTLLSLIISQELAKNGVSVFYEKNLGFLCQFKDKNFTNIELIKANSNKYLAVDLLIIDGVDEIIDGNVILHEEEKESLFFIINQRCQANLCTLMIFTGDINNFKTRLSRKIVNRLLEKGIVLLLDWPSYKYI